MNTLQSLQNRFKTQSFVGRHGPSLGSGLEVLGGCERRKTSDNYRWNGMRRGQPKSRPLVLLQYTLAGSGVIEASGHTHPLPPEHCMMAVIPSRHVYYLPAGVPSWMFIWVIINHPYVVQRVRDLIDRVGPCLPAAAGSDLPQQLCGLLQSQRDDALVREARLFDLIIAAERAAQSLRPAGSQREHLLRRVRDFVHAGGMARPNIEAIAADQGTSRSNFSHHFRAATGLTPAAYIRELRLDRARNEIIESDNSPKAIARTLGFADANHFGKLFSARFGYTPSALRRQLRS